MQVQSIQNNTNNTNFTSIKSVKFTRLLSKYPERGQELIDAFKQSPQAMEFCKKYDVNIVFDSHLYNEMMDVESGIHIKYDNPAKSKFKKFIDCIFSPTDDTISLQVIGRDWTGLSASVKESTKSLIKYILPDSKGMGVLDGHIKLHDKKIQNALKPRQENKVSEKIKNTKKVKDDLTDSIQDLINISQK